jgi:PAS domain S-box-containing protein
MVLKGSTDRSAPSRFRRVRLAIVGFTAVLVSGVIGFAGFDLWRGHRDAVDEAARTTQNLARTLEEHADGIFRRADLMLSSIAQATLQMGAGPDSTPTRSLVAAYTALLDPQETLILVDANGTVLFDPRDPFAHPNISDREYFTAHRDRSGSDLYAAPTLISLTGAGRFVGLSRRLSSPEGQFAGIVLYVVGGAYFRELYSSLNIGTSSNITLWNGAGSRVLARFPPDDRVMERSVERGELYRNVAEGRRAGLFQSVSPLDGISRMVGYRKLMDAPFVVSIGLAEADYLKRWHDGLTSYLFAVAAITVAILALSGLLLYQLNRWAASEARLAAVVANVPGALFQRRLDAEGRLSYPWVSAGVVDLHGFTAEAAMRDSSLLLNAIHPDDWKIYENRLATSVTDGAPVTWEGRIVRPDGRVKWIQVMSRPRTLYGGGVEWDGVILDITERKRMETALHTAREAADTANRSKSQFLANMSHELRTPLNAILGFSEILQAEYFGTLNVKQREYVGDIHRSGVYLLQVISNILDISKIEAGKDELLEETVHLGPVTQLQLALMMPQARSGDVKLVAEIPPNLPPLLADSVKLKQMLLNLLSNAIKFTPAGGTVSIRARLESGPGEAGGLALTVSDTGIGMKPEDIPAALEPFRRLDSGHMLRSLGTGLGLPITKAQIELHGGSLEIDSRLGVGTQVTLRFPRARVLLAEPSEDAHAALEPLLARLVELSDSHYGFVAEALAQDAAAAPALRMLTVVGIVTGEMGTRLDRGRFDQGVVISGPDTLYGEVITSGRPLFINDAATHPRRGATPAGHPPLDRFMGIPLVSGPRVIGMVGLANRAADYGPELIERLRPLLDTVARTLDAGGGVPVAQPAVPGPTA